MPWSTEERPAKVAMLREVHRMHQALLGAEGDATRRIKSIERRIGLHADTMKMEPRQDKACDPTNASSGSNIEQEPNSIQVSNLNSPNKTPDAELQATKPTMSPRQGSSENLDQG